MNAPKACILSVSGPELRDEEAVFLAQNNPWGIILMGRSIKTKNQVRALVDSIWSALGRPCLIFVDQEGGRVRRLRPPEWPDFPAAKVYSDLYKKSPELGEEAAWLGHRLMAAELQPLGIYADCAPNLDLSHPGAHDIVGDRAFGDTARQVSALGAAAIKGLMDGGVASVIKHIPGHGRAKQDSHEALPVVDASAQELEQDFSPFSALSDAPMAMTAHIAYQAYDAENAATVSRKIIRDVIRNRIGFDGLLMGDDLGMKALGGTLESRARASFEAGCDIALNCSGFQKDPEIILSEMRQVAGASPRLSGRAAERAKFAEDATLHRKPFDIEAGRFRFEELLAKVGADEIGRDPTSRVSV
ncbi:beta-N-acetylhexosaminidase [Hirschia maritima]|uniref:beta-N-acetylhexosaminidase n=1 Tax=Hirschia maritima TaxID=1121961 RepID=UPI00037CDC8D|nr:beta-N-acetylhexosaminidase [Hirschia maritima]